MGGFPFFLLSLLTVGSCLEDRCKPSRQCSGTGLIQFPFSLEGKHPQYCGYPGFRLSCDGNETVINIPSMGKMYVRDIDYKQHQLLITDPKECLGGFIFNIDNLSASPFHYSDVYIYTFINCSENVDSSFYYTTFIRCLSNVYSLYGDLTVDHVPESCKPIKTVRVGTQFSSLNSAYLDLRWDLPGCDGCELSGGKCGFKNQSSGDTIMCFHQGLKKKPQMKKLLIIGASLVSSLLLVITVISVKFYLSRKFERKLDLENEIKIEKFLADYKSLKPMRYSYADLKRMTDQFKDKLGEGGYGSVFKGKLPNGTLVAVKILKGYGGDGEEFINEVGTIGRIHHVNVVRLFGFCADRLKRALIYEFMPNESLEKYIFVGNNSEHFLGWKKLQDIAIGIARGIEYLHQGCDQRILHFDIKPHNILLDQNFNPKISDFGLAKLCTKGQSAVSIATARGTMGYIAPEVFSRNFGNVSYKSDVYSFGIMLLEMVGGRKNNDVTVGNKSQIYFPQWIYNRLCQGEGIGLQFTTHEDAVMAEKLAIVSLWCIQWSPIDRPCMNSVVQMLEGSTESLSTPPNPFASKVVEKSGGDFDKNALITSLSTIFE